MRPGHQARSAGARSGSARRCSRGLSSVGRPSCSWVVVSTESASQHEDASNRSPTFASMRSEPGRRGTSPLARGPEAWCPCRCGRRSPRPRTRNTPARMQGRPPTRRAGLAPPSAFARQADGTRPSRGRSSSRTVGLRVSGQLTCLVSDTPVLWGRGPKGTHSDGLLLPPGDQGACGRMPDENDRSGGPWGSALTGRRAPQCRGRGSRRFSLNRRRQTARSCSSNAMAEQLFEYGREELLGESVDRLVPLSILPSHAAYRAA